LSDSEEGNELRNVAIKSPTSTTADHAGRSPAASNPAPTRNQRRVERAMDSNDLELSAASPFLAKAASCSGRTTRINIVDTQATPISAASRAHSQHGGRRLVLCGAAEGSVAQTKFVVSEGAEGRAEADRRHQQGDRPDARPTEVINEVFDLFAALETPPRSSSTSRFCNGSAKRAGWRIAPDGQGRRACSRCST